MRRRPEVKWFERACAACNAARDQHVQPIPESAGLLHACARTQAPAEENQVPMMVAEGIGRCSSLIRISGSSLLSEGSPEGPPEAGPDVKILPNKRWIQCLRPWVIPDKEIPRIHAADNARAQIHLEAAAEADHRGH